MVASGRESRPEGTIMLEMLLVLAAVGAFIVWIWKIPPKYGQSRG